MKRHTLIGSIQRYSVEDGPGIRTTIFLKGCPLKCVWCHNPELIDFEQQLIKRNSRCISCHACLNVCPEKCITLEQEGVDINWENCNTCLECTKVCYAKAISPVAQSKSIDDLIDIAMKDYDYYKTTNGGVTISGGEPLSHFDFVDYLVDECKVKELNVCIDTSGFGDTDKLISLAMKNNVEYILFDMKCIDNEKHKKYTAVNNKIILKNLEELSEKSVTREKIWIRMPLIHKLNDSKEMVDETVKYLQQLKIPKVTLIPYHDFGVAKNKNIGVAGKKYQTPPDDYVQAIKNKFIDSNISANILGGDA